MANTQSDLRAVPTNDNVSDFPPERLFQELRRNFKESRHDFKEETTRALALALGDRYDLSCIALGLDRFDAVNDRHGQPAGDAILTAVVEGCKGVLRSTDVIGRLGGDDFAVLLPHRGRDTALDVAEKLCAAIRELTFEFDHAQTHISASFGVAFVDPTTRDVDTLLNNADLAMHKAKAEGGNRCVVFKSAAQDDNREFRRVFKGGQIFFNGRTTCIDCTVRSESAYGAGIDVSSTAGLPDVFSLWIEMDGIERRCRVLNQTKSHLEVEWTTPIISEERSKDKRLRGFGRS